MPEGLHGSRFIADLCARRREQELDSSTDERLVLRRNASSPQEDSQLPQGLLSPWRLDSGMQNAPVDEAHKICDATSVARSSCIPL